MFLYENIQHMWRQEIISVRPVLHCTAVHYTLVHYTAVYYTVPCELLSYVFSYRTAKSL